MLGKFTLLAAALSVAAACSSFDPNDIPPNTIRQLGTTYWHPAELTVSVGATVRWDVWSGNHGLWIVGEPDTAVRHFNGGMSYTRVFSKAGDYTYICSYPNHAYYYDWFNPPYWDGMVGEIHVQ
jgi:plastocyanin